MSVHIRGIGPDGQWLTKAERFHPMTCPNRGDGEHVDREGYDLGELVWDAARNAHVCRDCDYTQGDVMSVQAKRHQAASAIARLEAWKSASKHRGCSVYHTDSYDSTGWCCSLAEGVGDTARRVNLISGPVDDWGYSMASTINRALDAWEAGA